MDSSQPTTERVIVVQSPRAPVVGWVIAGLMGFIAAALVIPSYGPVGSNAAYGQNDTRLGARGIFAFTGQLSRATYGLFMMDVDNGTIWCYEISPQNRALKLVAARSWHFDRYLEEFNVDDPTPTQVAELVEQQRSNRRAQVSADAANP